MLPGIFRLDDPCVRLRLAPEDRHALEQILDALPAELFTADDALGWVYQFWQKEKKDEVNASERKIGGADLAPVTQLFTENYMVRFLLENSLGAWWAARHPDSPLLNELASTSASATTARRRPARSRAGRSASPRSRSWTRAAARATSSSRRSRHAPADARRGGRARASRAQAAVLRDNLFGLELDPRCTQIAMFAVALQAWKAGGGWRSSRSRTSRARGSR